MPINRVFPQPAHIPHRGAPYDDNKHAENYLAIQRWLDRAYVDVGSGFTWSAVVWDKYPIGWGSIHTYAPSTINTYIFKLVEQRTDDAATEFSAGNNLPVIPQTAVYSVSWTGLRLEFASEDGPAIVSIVGSSYGEICKTAYHHTDDVVDFGRAAVPLDEGETITAHIENQSSGDLTVFVADEDLVEGFINTRLAVAFEADLGQFRPDVPSSDLYETAVLSDGPTIFYQSQETTGTNGSTIFDTSGNSLDATVAAGNLTVNEDGPFNGSKSWLFDGNQTVSTPYNALFLVPSDGTGLLTVEWWQRTTDTDGFIWEHDSGSGSTRPWVVHQVTSDLQAFPNNQFGPVQSFTYPTNNGNWQYLVVTMDDPTGETKLYINGVFQETKTGSGQFQSGVNVPLTIGSHINGFQSFVGNLSNMALYVGQILNATQIAAHYEAATNQ